MVVSPAVTCGRILGAVFPGLFSLTLFGVFGPSIYRRYGNEFVFQTFVFHFLKGRDIERGVMIFLYPRNILDILAPLFVLGCWRIFTDRLFSRAVILVLAIVASEYLFYGVLSPTAWGHNYLEALPFIAIIAGIGGAELVGAIGELTSEDPRRFQWRRLVARLAVVAI